MGVDVGPLNTYPPRKWTNVPPKNNQFQKEISIFQPSIFRGYVSFFWGGILNCTQKNVTKLLPRWSKPWPNFICLEVTNNLWFCVMFSLVSQLLLVLRSVIGHGSHHLKKNHKEFHACRKNMGIGRSKSRLMYILLGMRTPNIFWCLATRLPRSGKCQLGGDWNFGKGRIRIVPLGKVLMEM